MKTKKWFYFWSQSKGSYGFVETKKLAYSMQEVKDWANKNDVEIDGKIRLSKKQNSSF